MTTAILLIIINILDVLIHCLHYVNNWLLTVNVPMAATFKPLILGKSLFNKSCSESFFKVLKFRAAPFTIMKSFF